MEKNNNYGVLRGKIINIPTYNHSVMDENFFVFPLKVKRLSGNNDIINITISEKLHKIYNLSINDTVEVSGQFRSYNNYSGVGSKLILTLFAQNITYIEDNLLTENPNFIHLNGYICKPTVYRTTPFGREITDIILAVNRAYGKSDYIPCILWGRNAKFASYLNVGDNVDITGRIQSREYQKKLSDDEIITKTAYEISVSKIDITKEKGDLNID